MYRYAEVMDRRASNTEQDSVVHLQLKDKGHSLEDRNVHIQEKEDSL